MSALASTIQQVGLSTQVESQPQSPSEISRTVPGLRSCLKARPSSRSAVESNNRGIVWADDRPPSTAASEHSYQSTKLDIPTADQRSPMSDTADQDGHNGSAWSSHQHHLGAKTDSHGAHHAYHDAYDMEQG
ncbi:hypothetical protein I302_100695 [Kwoniella bestiolae CBS 10118]|uniref:Uncharacterized protein n=1 Tax=Kwoniella bestiolae CBS 10118 TaxID=1296100 RepID=A0AAJ8M5N6_9TREE